MHAGDSTAGLFSYRSMHIFAGSPVSKRLGGQHSNQGCEDDYVGDMFTIHHDLVAQSVRNNQQEQAVIEALQEFPAPSSENPHGKIIRQGKK